MTKKKDGRKTMWNPIPKDTKIHYPSYSPTFGTKELDKAYKEVFGKGKPKKKVYCLMCRYHGRHIDGSSKCFNDKNITNRRYKDTYLSREEDFDYISSPMILNKNNDCRWYKSDCD